MPLQPQVEEYLRQMAGLNVPPAHRLPLDQARANMRAAALLNGDPPPVRAVEDRRIPGPNGPVPVRIYRPGPEPRQGGEPGRGQGDVPGPRPSDATGPAAALVYFHGGGWVLGDLDTHDYVCRELANATPCTVVAVDYRLSPEHRFPAAVEDGYAVAACVARYGLPEDAEKNARVLAGPSRVAVGGDSAGGNLAAAVALMARDRGGPALIFQLLVYPITQHALDTPSYETNAVGYGLTREAMAWYWEQYLASPADGRHPYASPLLASDLRELPPALVMTAEYDPLRDEGEAYAARLRTAGVSATCSRYHGQIHGFFSRKALDPARAGVREAATALRAAFAR